MLKAKDGDFFVTDWLRNRNTLEFIGIWEQVYNPNFNYGEFATIRGQAGLNSFKIGVQEFVQRTHAICLCSKAGRYGGTYAHKDIAFEFAMWISAEFKIYIWLLRRGRPVRRPFRQDSALPSLWVRHKGQTQRPLKPRGQRDRFAGRLDQGRRAKRSLFPSSANVPRIVRSGIAASGFGRDSGLETPVHRECPSRLCSQLSNNSCASAR